jgi:hypothetical protein
MSVHHRREFVYSAKKKGRTLQFGDTDPVWKCSLFVLFTSIIMVNKSRRTRHAARMGEMKAACKILVGTTERKRSYGI